MQIENQIDVLKKGRALILKLVKDLSLEQINRVPPGHKNNIGWNVAHLVVTQQLLCYKMSGLDLNLSHEMIEKYKKGTAIKDVLIEKNEWQLILQLFIELPTLFVEDFKNNRFEVYHNYTTSVGITLDSIEKAIDFNNFHEGIHLGVILAQKKLV